MEHASPQVPLTYQQFLDFVAEKDGRYEYVDGRAVAMDTPWRRIGQFFVNLGNGLLDFGSAAVLVMNEGYSHIDSLRLHCMRYGWCFTPDFPLEELLSSAIDLSTATNPQHTLYRRVRDFLLADDARELRSFLDSFAGSPSLNNKRRKILSDCIQALDYHGRRRFNAANLVVPTVLGVIDGMATGIRQLTSRS
jgi:hypothetical protein